MFDGFVVLFFFNEVASVPSCTFISKIWVRLKIVIEGHAQMVSHQFSIYCRLEDLPTEPAEETKP